MAPSEDSVVQGEVIAVVGGFETFAPTVVPQKYEILGDDMQVLSVKLSQDEVMTSEAGAMNFMHPSVRMSVNCKDCCGRWCSGEACIMSTYHATGPDGYVALTSRVPGKIVPIDLAAHSGKIRAKNDAFFASIGDVRVAFDLDLNCFTCCCSGQGLIHQSMLGEGTAFLSAMGTILQKRLEPGEVIVIDTHSLVAWENTAKLGVRRAGGCCTCCCGGEGLFNTTVTGPGHIYLQSMSREKFKAALAVQAARNQQQPTDGGGPPISDDMER